MPDPAEPEERPMPEDDKAHNKEKSTLYHFRSHERVPEAVKRMVLEQIDKALGGLEARGDGIDEAIHEARVCLKKIRAVLRLVREEIGDQKFKAENRRYRDAGRRLSSVRDSAVIIDTFDKLTSDEAVSTTTYLTQMRARLIRAEGTPVVEKEEALLEVTAVIAEARADLEDWQIDHKGFAALEPGLKRVYRDGRTVLGIVQERPTVENLHELRKQVKTLYYQIHLVGHAWPAILEPFDAELKDLTDLLSDHHDLAVLGNAVSEARENQSDGDLEQEILDLINRRQRELRMEAMPLVQRIYVEKPAAFVRRIEGYWNAWRPEIA
jgi:CHAD domain-containing protein